MRALRDIIRAAALHERDLFEIMRCANKLACIERMAVPVTAIVAVLNTQQRMLTVLNAGHPRPLVHTNAGGTFVGRCPGGPPLGISEDNAWPLDSIAVPAGAMLVFYTDGIIERERNPIKGERDLCLAASHVYRFPYLNHANAIAQGLTGGDVALEDDAAILTVRTT
jgi:serine phosphatase RsbU (regulator of sigma subunit)